MRTVRLMHAAFIAVLIVLDTYLGSFVNSLGISQFVYVSSLAFIGLLLLSQTEDAQPFFIKVMLVGVYLDLNQVGVFPSHLVAYLVTFLLMFQLKSYIGNSLHEFYVFVIIALSINELLVYLINTMVFNTQMSLVYFVSVRSFWVIVGACVCLPLVVSFNKRMHRYILQKAQNIYMG